MQKFTFHRLGALLVVIMVSLLLAACGGDGGTNAGSSNADLLKKAAANMKAAKSYHLDVNAETSGMNITMAADVDVTNKAAAMKVGAMGTNIDMVTVDGKTYQSMDGKTYSESTSSSGMESFTGMWDSFKPEDVDKSADKLKDGSPATEKIDGTDTKHMTADIKDLSGLAAASGGNSTSMTGTIDIWVTTDANATVRQMKINGDSGGQKVIATIKWSKINDPVTVKKPETVQ